MQSIQSSGVAPDSILKSVADSSVKNYILGSTLGAAAIAKGTELVDKAGEKAGEITANTKEQLQKLKDMLKGYSGSGTSTNSSGRIPLVNPGVNLRGQIGATSPAKY